MKSVSVFVETSTTNRILDIDVKKAADVKREEDREFLSKILKNYVKKGVVKLIVNPSVKREIENTSDPQRKRRLLALFNQFCFMPYNKTIFPFTFPAYFVTKEEKKELGRLCKKIKGFEKDEKIFLDAVSNSQIEALLTTDRKHLARNEIHHYLKSKGLDKRIKIFTPKELFEDLQQRI